MWGCPALDARGVQGEKGRAAACVGDGVPPGGLQMVLGEGSQGARVELVVLGPQGHPGRTREVPGAGVHTQSSPSPTLFLFSLKMVPAKLKKQGKKGKDPVP